MFYVDVVVVVVTTTLTIAASMLGCGDDDLS